MKGPSIIVGHHNPQLQNVIKQLLVKAGYEYVVTALTGRRVFDYLMRLNFDLLIIEPQLTDLNCWQILRAIRTGAFFSSRLPVLILCETTERVLIEPLSLQYHAQLLTTDQLGKLVEIAGQSISKIKKPTVLLIEDHSETANLISSRLKVNFDVEIASNGVKGLEAWRKHHHHLVLLDLMLPDLDGTRILVQILQEDKNQVIAIITGRHEKKLHQELILAGAAAFLTKPIDLQELPFFCERILYDNHWLNQNTHLKPQEEQNARLIEYMYRADYFLEQGRPYLASQQIKHALAQGKDRCKLSDDEWIHLLDFFDNDHSF